MIRFTDVIHPRVCVFVWACVCVQQKKVSVKAWLNVSASRWVERKGQNSKRASEKDKENLDVRCYSDGPHQKITAVHKTSAERNPVQRDAEASSHPNDAVTQAPSPSLNWLQNGLRKNQYARTCCTSQTSHFLLARPALSLQICQNWHLTLPPGKSERGRLA